MPNKLQVGNLQEHYRIGPLMGLTELGLIMLWSMVMGLKLVSVLSHYLCFFFYNT